MNIENYDVMYLLYFHGYPDERPDNLGIFSSEEKAKEALTKELECYKNTKESRRLNRHYYSIDQILFRG